MPLSFAVCLFFRYSVLLWIPKNMNHNLSKVEHSFDKTFFEHFQGYNKTNCLRSEILNTSLLYSKVRKKAKIRIRYNQVPHLTQDTTWERDKTQENISYKMFADGIGPDELPQIWHHLGLHCIICICAPSFTPTSTALSIQPPLKIQT